MIRTEQAIIQIIIWFNELIKEGNYSKAKRIEKVIDRFFKNNGKKRGWHLINFTDGNLKGRLYYGKKRKVKKYVLSMGYKW